MMKPGENTSHEGFDENHMSVGAEESIAAEESPQIAGLHHLAVLTSVTGAIAGFPNLESEVRRGDIASIRFAIRLLFDTLFLGIAIINLVFMDLFLFDTPAAHSLAVVARMQILFAVIVAGSLRFTRNLRLTERLSAWGFLIYMLASGWFAARNELLYFYVWSVAFLPVAYYLEGPVGGFFLSLVYCALAVILYAVHIRTGGTHLPPELLRNFVGVSMVLLMFLFIFEAMRATYDKLVDQLTRTLRERAVTDQLTGLYNRRRMVDFLQDEISRATRLHHVFAVVMFDIDHFKRVNDTYGHTAGDTTLIQISRLTEELVRGTDLLGRWGGEEFMMVLPGTNAAGAVLLCNRIRDKVSTFRFPEGIRLTVSFGITEYNDGDTIQTLVDRADVGLYRAKERGRNRVETEVSR